MKNFPKVSLRRGLFAALCLLIGTLQCVFLCSCSGGVPTLTPKDGAYYNKKAEISYADVPTCFEPIAEPNTSKEYAVIKTNDFSCKLYTVPGADPAQWLTTEEGILFRATTVPLPTLSSFETNEISLCETNQKTVALATLSNAEEVRALVACLTEGEHLEYSDSGLTSHWRVRFTSAKYSGICYTASLLYYADGIRVYDALSDELAQTVEDALAAAREQLTEEEIAAGVEPEPVIPEGYRYLSDDPRVKTSLIKTEYTAPDGSLAVEWAVAYHYGHYFLYDRSSKLFVPAWDLLTEAVEGTESQS